MTRDPVLQTAIKALALPGVMVEHRIILPGDEHALMREEAVPFARAVVSVRRASGAARIIARHLLAALGHDGCAVPKAASGAPMWPEGIVGSISHDPCIAVAAAARERDFAALGIDVEPSEPLPPDLLDLIATPRERAEVAENSLEARLLFAAKEAVYKAVYPLDRTFLDFQDVEVNFARCRAVVRTGREVELRFCVSSHMLVLAFIRGGAKRESFDHAQDD